MIKAKIQKTKYHSYKLGQLPKGCQYCVSGEKLVLFVTGLCPRCCYYCTISDKKYKKDVVYANEWPTRKISEIIKEAKLCSAKGAGITGGDPLCKLDRTINFIKALKKEFGKNFHIHLYTSLNLVNEKTLDKLHKAGLDEIRFHIDLGDLALKSGGRRGMVGGTSSDKENKKLWSRLILAKSKKFKWKVGIEIPVITDKEKETKEIIDYFADKIDFLNLNELEVADNKMSQLTKLGFKTKNKLSYAVKGSEEMALNLLKYAEKNHPKMNVHYCTATLKDRVQLANRIKKRAENVAKEYDIITTEGLLLRGAIYGNIKKIKKILEKNHVPKNLYDIDIKRGRIVTSVKVADVLKKSFKKHGARPAIVEEYPTYDCLQVDVDFL